MYIKCLRNQPTKLWHFIAALMKGRYIGNVQDSCKISLPTFLQSFKKNCCRTFRARSTLRPFDQFWQNILLYFQAFPDFIKFYVHKMSQKPTDRIQSSNTHFFLRMMHHQKQNLESSAILAIFLIFNFFKFSIFYFFS